MGQQGKCVVGRGESFWIGQTRFTLHSDEDAQHVYYYAILPNFLLNLHPDFMLTFQLWPQAADRTDVVCEWHYHPDAIARASSLSARSRTKSRLASTASVTRMMTWSTQPPR